MSIAEAGTEQLDERTYQMLFRQQQQQQQQRLWDKPEINNNNRSEQVYANVQSQMMDSYPVHYSSSMSSLPGGYGTLPGLGGSRRSAFRPVKPPRKVTTSSVGELEEYARKFEDLYSNRRARGSGSTPSGGQNCCDI